MLTQGSICYWVKFKPTADACSGSLAQRRYVLGIATWKSEFIFHKNNAARCNWNSTRRAVIWMYVGQLSFCGLVLKSNTRDRAVTRGESTGVARRLETYMWTSTCLLGELTLSEFSKQSFLLSLNCAPTLWMTEPNVNGSYLLPAHLPSHSESFFHVKFFLRIKEISRVNVFQL